MSQRPNLGGGTSRVATRVFRSQFAVPVARVALVAMGLVLLAVIGRVASARSSSPEGAETASPEAPSSEGLSRGHSPVSAPSPSASAPAAQAASWTASPQGVASPDAPVVLNTAVLEDLMRLPGIGQKRGMAILALRERLGRFHAVEDLLKVKGLGRASLKRLRPHLRVDPPPLPPSPPTDAGAPIFD